MGQTFTLEAVTKSIHEVLSTLTASQIGREQLRVELTEQKLSKGV